VPGTISRLRTQPARQGKDRLATPVRTGCLIKASRRPTVLQVPAEWGFQAGGQKQCLRPEVVQHRERVRAARLNRSWEFLSQYLQQHRAEYRSWHIFSRRCLRVVTSGGRAVLGRGKARALRRAQPSLLDFVAEELTHLREPIE